MDGVVVQVVPVDHRSIKERVPVLVCSAGLGVVAPVVVSNVGVDDVA